MTDTDHMALRLPAPTPGRQPDSGLSLVEILVSVVLLGTVGVALLASLQATILGSRVGRDHAQAHEWLQSATEVLVNDVAWADCDDTDSAGSSTSLQNFYETELRAKSTIIPPGWAPARLVVPIGVEFAGASGAYGSTCLATEDRQRITIQVQNPDGDIIERVEVVKVP